MIQTLIKNKIIESVLDNIFAKLKTNFGNQYILEKLNDLDSIKIIRLKEYSSSGYFNSSSGYYDISNIVQIYRTDSNHITVKFNKIIHYYENKQDAIDAMFEFSPDCTFSMTLNGNSIICENFDDPESFCDWIPIDQILDIS